MIIHKVHEFLAEHGAVSLAPNVYLISMEYMPAARGKGNLKFCIKVESDYKFYMNPITNEVRACETIRDLMVTLLKQSYTGG